MGRTDDLWENRNGDYIETISPYGYDILINGTDKYLNFNTISGSSGYGFRDNGGTMQWKNSGGSWQNIGSGGGGGSPGGLNTQVQYNNSGSFGGITGAVTDGTILSLTNPLIGGATITTSTVNGVTLTTGGGTTTFLNANGAYSTPVGTVYTGTANRITVTGTVIDIAATYVGQSSITTLGTIATGVWNGTKVGLAYGGTNADLSGTGGTAQYLKQSSTGSAITVGNIPASDIASGAALTRVNDTNVTLTLGGTPSSALLVATSITVSWSGTLGLSRGGTSADLSGTGGASQVLRQSSVGGAITVSQLAASDLSNGTTGSGAVALAVSPALTGTPTAPTAAIGDSSTTLATTAFVQTAILTVPGKDAVKYASIAALPSIVYANGASGVGATLTGVALAAISLDGASPGVGDRVLIKNQVSTFQNGIYIVTQTGSGIAVFILTRATDFDQSADIQTGANTFVLSGSTLANTTWAVNSASSPVIGTDPITFIQEASSAIVVGTTPISNGTNTRILYDNSGIVGEYTLTGTGTVVAMQTAPTFITSITDPLVIGGTGTTSTLTFRTTSGVGTTNADMIFQVGNAGATEAMRILNSAFIGMGTNAPDAILTVSKQNTIQAVVSGSLAHFVGLDANPLRINFDTHNTGTAGTALFGRRSRGTAASPSALASGDTMYSLNALGYGTTSYAAASTGLISFKAAEVFSDTAMGTDIVFTTTPTSSVTAAEVGRFTGTQLKLGVTGTMLGSLFFSGNTSTGITVQGVAAGLSGVNTLQAVTDTFVYKATTDTLTNKRITKRVTVASDATSITPNSDNADVTQQTNTQAAGTLTINADGGTPTNIQSWVLVIKSTNAQTFAWNSLYVGGQVALPIASSGGSKIDMYAFVYSTINSKWIFTGQVLTVT